MAAGWSRSRLTWSWSFSVASQYACSKWRAFFLFEVGRAAAPARLARREKYLEMRPPS